MCISCAYQPSAHCGEMRAQWIQVWKIAARSIPTPSACRAACHLLSVLLAQKLVEYASIADLLDGIVTSVEHNGPALLVDSSLSLWALITELRQRELPSANQSTAECVLRWLFSRWSPGISRLHIQPSVLPILIVPSKISRQILYCSGLSAHSAP